jgi:hypothetical protein
VEKEGRKGVGWIDHVVRLGVLMFLFKQVIVLGKERTSALAFGLDWKTCEIYVSQVRNNE